MWFLYMGFYCIVPKSYIRLYDVYFISGCYCAWVLLTQKFVCWVLFPSNALVTNERHQIMSFVEK